MCASALRQIGIRKVYFGCGNDKFGGNGSVFDVNQEYVSFFPPWPPYSSMFVSTGTNNIYDFVYLNSERLLTPTSLPYESEGGHRREDAIMLLRKFYVRENNHAPLPKKKANRVLKTEIESSS
ncbi:unnamed protein product [Umbelopsis ramanniana]